MGAEDREIIVNGDPESAATCKSIPPKQIVHTGLLLSPPVMFTTTYFFELVDTKSEFSGHLSESLPDKSELSSVTQATRGCLKRFFLHTLEK